MYEEQVQNGIQWMQENHPGKLQKVNRWRLDLRLYATCVIGQTLGPDEFRDMEIENGEQWMADHGFNLEDSIGRPEEDWEPLTEAWKVALSDLFSED